MPYSPKQRAILALAPPTAAAFFKSLCASCRLEVRNREHFEAVEAEHGHVIIAIWHEILGLAAWYYRNSGYTTLTSQSYDGELAARVVNRFGLTAARGSSTRGGFQGLQDLLRAIKRTPGVGLTVDGPKGPRRVAKPGVSIVSALSRIPITTTAIVATPAWRLNSWDRFVIPKPMGRIIVAFGPPVPPPADRSPEALEATRLQVEQTLNDLHASLNDPA